MSTLTMPDPKPELGLGFVGTTLDGASKPIDYIPGVDFEANNYSRKVDVAAELAAQGRTGNEVLIDLEHQPATVIEEKWYLNGRALPDNHPLMKYIRPETPMETLTPSEQLAVNDPEAYEALKKIGTDEEINELLTEAGQAQTDQQKMGALLATRDAIRARADKAANYAIAAPGKVTAYIQHVLAEISRSLSEQGLWGTLKQGFWLAVGLIQKAIGVIGKRNAYGLLLTTATGRAMLSKVFGTTGNLLVKGYLVLTWGLSKLGAPGKTLVSGMDYVFGQVFTVGSAIWKAVEPRVALDSKLITFLRTWFISSSVLRLASFFLPPWARFPVRVALFWYSLGANNRAAVVNWFTGTKNTAKEVWSDITADGGPVKVQADVAAEVKVDTKVHRKGGPAAATA